MESSAEVDLLVNKVFMLSCHVLCPIVRLRLRFRFYRNLEFKPLPNLTVVHVPVGLTWFE